MRFDQTVACNNFCVWNSTWTLRRHKSIILYGVLLKLEFIKSIQNVSKDRRLVPGLKNMPVPVQLTRKIRYTNKKAPVQRPFLLAGELAPPAGRVLRVSSTGTGMFFRPGTNLNIRGNLG